MSNLEDFINLRKLDDGSMGVVYYAETQDGQPVAIKTFFEEPGQESKLREWLVSEGRKMRELDHPNIVKVFDVVDAPDIAFLVMEYVDGVNLDKYLTNNPNPEHEQTISFLRQAASALDYAAQKGLVHRDVKPANMLISSDGNELKLTDFGIAKRTGNASMSSASASLSEGRRVGTLAYMAPEQITDPKSVSSRADQYALATVAYRMLTGRRVFEDHTGETSLGMAIVNVQAPKPSQFSRGLGSIDKVMKRALSKKPLDRFPNCTGFVEALDEALFRPPVRFPAWAKLAAIGAVVVVGLWAGVRYLTPTPQNQTQNQLNVDPPLPPGPGAATGPINVEPKIDPGPTGTVVARVDPAKRSKKPAAPKFTLELYARDTKLTNGQAFAIDDDNLGGLASNELKFKLNVNRPLPVDQTRVRLRWERKTPDGKVDSIADRQVDEHDLNSIQPLLSRPRVGEQDVWIEWNGEEVARFSVTIKPSE